jgi:iron complex outermembrane receptor protein
VCQTQTGEVRSRGVELGAKFAVTDNLNLIASYSYNDIKVTKSNVANVEGNTPVGAPEHMANLWADYTLSDGPLAGLGFGGGARYIGGTYGDATNTDAMKVPGYTLFDAAVHYDFGQNNPEFKGLTAAVNVTNLFNKEYVAACASAAQCFYGTGRTVMATLAYKW